MTQPIPTKHLLLFRHAKSDWGTATEDDHARPLTKRGIAAARAMGRILAASGQMPDRIVTSSAVRAKTTLEVARAAGKWKCQTEISDALYDTDAAAVLEEIRTLPKSTTTVLFVGHEPTWSELASFLIGGGNLRFPTAALARIDLIVPGWHAVTFGRGELVWLLQPRFFTKGKFPLKKLDVAN